MDNSQFSENQLNNLGDDELNKLVEDKRSELNALTEKQGADRTPSDELLKVSKELDVLLNVAHSRKK